MDMNKEAVDRELDACYDRALCKAYRIARGHTDAYDNSIDGFAIHGRSQMYWKGRSDAAAEISKAREELLKARKKA